MKVANAALYFDKEEVFDAYSGDFLFKCQFTSFDDSQSSGASSRRRVLSTSPNATIPARKVVSIFSEPWVVGDGGLDGFKGKAIRNNFNLKKASGLYEILTPGQACLAVAGTTAYGHARYLKDTIDTATTSEYDPFWNVFFSSTESIAKGAFFKLDSKLFRVRSGYLTDDKYFLAQADELDTGCRVAVTFTHNGTYDVLTDSYPTVSVATFGIIVEVPKFFRLSDEAEGYEKAGDKMLFVAKSAVTPVVGGTVSIASKDWRIDTVVDELDSWALRVVHL